MVRHIVTLFWRLAALDICAHDDWLYGYGYSFPCVLAFAVNKYFLWLLAASIRRNLRDRLRHWRGAAISSFFQILTLARGRYWRVLGAGKLAGLALQGAQALLDDIPDIAVVGWRSEIRLSVSFLSFQDNAVLSSFFDVVNLL